MRSTPVRASVNNTASSLRLLSYCVSMSILVSSCIGLGPSYHVHDCLLANGLDSLDRLGAACATVVSNHRLSGVVMWPQCHLKTGPTPARWLTSSRTGFHGLALRRQELLPQAQREPAPALPQALRCASCSIHLLVSEKQAQENVRCSSAVLRCCSCFNLT